MDLILKEYSTSINRSRKQTQRNGKGNLNIKDAH